MDLQKVINGLNEILSIEYAGMIQNLQHSYLVQGIEREFLRNFFRESAKRSFEKHTKLVGEKVVALGGVPTVEPAMIRQSADTMEMLQQALQLETKAQNAHKQLLPAVEDDIALRFMLEEMIFDEQLEIDQLEMLLAQKRPAVLQKEIRLKESA